MLVPFERLVRPYQIREIRLGNGAFVQRRIPVVETEAEEAITSVLEWTATTSAEEATIPEQQYGPPLDYSPDEERETGREVVVRRVENPEDPSQYVDVQDAIKIRMSAVEEAITELAYEIVQLKQKKEGDKPIQAGALTQENNDKTYKYNVPEG